MAGGVTGLAATQSGHSPEEHEVVDCGQLRVEGELLWTDADDLSYLVALPRDGVAADGDVAVVGLENGGEHSDGRGLASSVRSEQAEYLLGADGEGDVVDGLDGAKGFSEMAGYDKVLGCGQVGTSGWGGFFGYRV